MGTKILRYIHEATRTDRTRLGWADLSELGLVAIGFLCYFLVRGGVVDRAGVALHHARWIIEQQRAVGVFWEPALNAWTLAATWRIDLFNFVYFWMDFPLIVGVGLLLFWRRRLYYTVLRDSLLISGAFALVMYWFFPVAPPRYLPEWGFVDTLEQFANLSYQAQSMAPFVNPFAAVPSLHVGWALLLTIVLFRATTNWAVRIAALSVPVLQSFAVLGTANHFIFDGVVGLVVSLLALLVADWLQDRGYPLLRAWIERRVPMPDAARA